MKRTLLLAALVAASTLALAAEYIVTEVTPETPVYSQPDDAGKIWILVPLYVDPNHTARTLKLDPADAATLGDALSKMGRSAANVNAKRGAR